MTSLSLMKLNFYTIKTIRDMRQKGKLVINYAYQRSDVWKLNKKKELIGSILDNYPIGVIVLWDNKGKIEVLDGQQRIKAIENFIGGKEKVTDPKGKQFSKIGSNNRSKFYGYEVPYLKLDKSLNERQVSDIFIRLQEGITLSLGEKLYAFRSNFRDVFVNGFFSKENELFFDRLNDKRFKARFLAAMLLALELKTNFERDDFPNLTYSDFKEINETYRAKKIPDSVEKRFNKNLQFLGRYLYGMLGRLTTQEIVPPYLLVSYFTRTKVHEKNQGEIFKEFLLEFYKDLNSFSIVKPRKPRTMKKNLYDKLMDYKINTRRGIVSESFLERFEIIKKEYVKRVGQIRKKDPQRYANNEQKRELYFKQKGKCSECNKELFYKDVEADHIVKHATGGRTRIDNLRLIHHKCHEKIHKTDQKSKSNK